MAPDRPRCRFHFYGGSSLLVLRNPARVRPGLDEGDQVFFQRMSLKEEGSLEQEMLITQWDLLQDFSRRGRESARIEGVSMWNKKGIWLVGMFEMLEEIGWSQHNNPWDLNMQHQGLPK